jgi:predicted type IV restriction endonuclease
LYNDDELGVQLFQAGISNKNIEDIIKALRQAERLHAWYRSEANQLEISRRPSENEVVSHIVLPLFLGLGWSHQQIAVEWKNVDMAFFENAAAKEKDCVMILEAKGLGQPLDDVLEQPRRYVASLGLKRTKYIITTDGANLFVYRRKGKAWDSVPVGYINIRSIQKENILPKHTNLIDTLVMLQPSSV